MADRATILHTVLRAAAVLLAAHYAGFADSATAQQRTPPKPAQPSSVLRMPDAVRAQGVQGRATLPAGLKLGFALDIADTVRGGNWDVTAIVTDVQEGVVTLRTSSGTVGHLVYRLPSGLALRLVANQKVVINREVIGQAASLGYALTLTGDDRLLLASGRLLGDSQLIRSVVPGLDVVQRVGEKRQPSESRYETIFQVPADLVIDGAALRLVTGQPVAFTRRGVDYAAALTHSSETNPAKGYEGVAEGPRYALEYAIAAK